MTSQPDRPDPPGHAGDPLERVLTLIRYLRVHCPWDARQTALSLVPHLLEEAHEVAQAIRDRARPDDLSSELGDLLLNVAYQVVVAEEGGGPGAAAVVRALERKMVRRHPHVDWSGYPLPLPDAVRGADTEPGPGPGDWELRKAAERGPGASALDGIARGLEPLARAHAIQERAAAVGFDWDDLEGPAAKVLEELEEAREALARRASGAGSDGQVEGELGDLLFAVVNLARRAGVHPGNALATANAKFERRYRRMEALLAGRGARAADLSLAELDAVWEEVKGAEARA